VDILLLDPNNIISKEFFAFGKLLFCGNRVEVCVSRYGQSRIITHAGFDWVGDVYQFGQIAFHFVVREVLAVSILEVVVQLLKPLLDTKGLGGSTHHAILIAPIRFHRVIHDFDINMIEYKGLLLDASTWIS
jgi:hypothetical protein